MLTQPRNLSAQPPPTAPFEIKIQTRVDSPEAARKWMKLAADVDRVVANADIRSDVGVKESVKVTARGVLQLPDKIEVAVGRMACIEVGDPDVGWKIVGDEVDSFREYDPAKIKIRVIGYQPSVAWLVVADAAKNISACKIIVGTPVPPAPPAPPTPPPPLEPTDPFFAILKAAWQSEAVPDKAAVASLAALYRQSAATTVNDATLKTAGDFFRTFKAAVDSLVPAAALPRVRPALGAELARVLPTSASAPLDVATRQLIATHYARIAADLEGLK